MIDHDDESIKFAIEAAERKRDQILKEIQGLSVRLNQLASFINQGRSIIGKQPEKPEIPKPETKAEKAVQVLTEKTNEDKVIEVVRESGHPMKISEIAKVFHSKTWPLGKNKRSSFQIIRNNLLKLVKKGIFIRLDDQSWDLKDRTKHSDAPRLFRDATNLVHG